MDTTEWRRIIAANACKSDFELVRLFRAHQPLGKISMFVISRQEIEERNFNRFTEAFSIYRKRRYLNELHASVLLSIHGYDRQPEPLFTLPEVRQYIAGCHKRRPAWLYFIHPHSETLAFVLTCLTTSMSSIHRENGSAEVVIPKEKVTQFVSETMPLLRIFRKKCGIKTGHLDAIRSYFGLPELPS